MRLAKRSGGGGPGAPQTVGSLHITTHHLIFRSDGNDENWVRPHLRCWAGWLVCA